jgi:predicted enzyme related to lactoylglutathione lyase
MTAPANAAVWFEIPVTDLDRSKRFYDTVLQTELTLEEGGPNRMAVFPGDGAQSVRGHLYPGKPAASGTGNTVHLAVGAPIEAAMERVTSAGGTVVSPAIRIPAGTFAYCEDPDGNSFGLFV